jgi:hypothetical protein
MKRPKKRDGMIAQLEAWAARPLSAGQDIKGVLQVGELDVEVLARVRRRAEFDDIRAYRASALAYLDGNRHLVWHCGCSVTRKAIWSRTGKTRDDCKSKIAAVVVFQSMKFDFSAPSGQQARTERNFLFVCGRHRENHHIDRARILATVELPPASYASILRDAEAEAARRNAEWQRDQHSRDAVQRALAQARRADAAAGGTSTGGKRVVPLVDVDRLDATESARLKSYGPRPGDRVEMQDCPPGQETGRWVQAIVSEVGRTGFLGLDERGGTWSREFGEGRWRVTSIRGPAEAWAAMELLHLGQSIEVLLVENGDRKWLEATVEAFRVGGFRWRLIEAVGHAEGIVDLDAAGDTWRLLGRGT